MRKSKKRRKMEKLKFEKQLREVLKEYVKCEEIENLEVIETPRLDKWFEEFCEEIEKTAQ